MTADCDEIAVTPPTRAANPQRLVPDGTSATIAFGPYKVAAGGEGNCPLWDGQIIDATFPPV
jgi:hypothetical protein